MFKKNVSVLGIIFIVLLPVMVQSGSDEVFRRQKRSDIFLLNNPPENVSVSGPVFGRAGELTEYAFYCDDPEGDNVLYYIKWESSCPAVYGPFESSVDTPLSYLWGKSGFYTISFKAVDTYGAESEIVYFDIVMPMNNYARYISFLNNVFDIFYEK
ncbi:MAG TPA: hypothetical protein VKP59_05480 [Candidatus Thermoplasmatota archaeon]|nr:hypothetical protein [Candidatus Thermoplasmatota archaeon]